jgi:pimeloyl-ACP methyl ester carboxylesterase
VWLVGHSLGGYLSLMAAARTPAWRGVLLLDAPVVGGWRATALAWPNARSWSARYHPARSAANGATNGPTPQPRWHTFRAQTGVRRWDPQVLADYIAHGTHDVAWWTAKRSACCALTRDVETAIYNTLPHNGAC